VVEGVVQRPTGVQSILDTQLFKRRVHGDERRDDDVIQQLEQHVDDALAELHLISERSNGGRQIGRRTRVGVEQPQTGGRQQDERNVEVVGDDSTARVERLDDQDIV